MMTFLCLVTALICLAAAIALYSRQYEVAVAIFFLANTVWGVIGWGALANLWTVTSVTWTEYQQFRKPSETTIIATRDSKFWSSDPEIVLLVEDKEWLPVLNTQGTNVYGNTLTRDRYIDKETLLSYKEPK